MYKLETAFSEEERRILEPYKKDIIILNQIEFECFEIAYDKKGELSFEECFGKQENLKEKEIRYVKEMRYRRIIPKRAIKIYQYYLIETYDEPRIWHQGEVENNGNVEFYAKIESFEYALQSL